MNMPGNSNGGLRQRIWLLLGVLAFANLAAWGWALEAFRHYPVLLGTALLAYGFGLRHAVDADHIAAIDNVTRKLVQDCQRPVAVGFWFSLGHASVVVLATLAVTLAASFKDRIPGLQQWGGVVGTLVSAGFLLLVALANLLALAGLLRVFRQLREPGGVVAPDIGAMVPGGFLARLFRPLFGAIGRSWHMYPLGFLFGLGFDTATEVGLLGISAAEATHGLPVWSIMVFPALFTAGMALVDSLDGVLMLGAYGWAFLQPMRKVYYNIIITAVSILVAVIVGGIETLGLLRGQFSLTGWFWTAIGALNENFGTLGYAIIGLFLLAWGISALVYRWKRFDQLAG